MRFHTPTLLLVICLLAFNLCGAQNKIDTDTGIVRELLLISDNIAFSHPDSAIQYCEEALEQAEQLNYDYGKIWAYNNLGSAYWVKGNYVSSLEYFQKIIDFAEQKGDTAYAAKGLGNIAVIYIDLDDLDLAYDYTHKALRSYYTVKDTAGIAVSTNNLGIIFEKREYYDSALYYFDIAATYWGYQNDKNWLTLVESNRSNIYAKKGSINKALRHAMKAGNYAQKINNEKSKGHAYLSLANAMYLKKHYKEAVFYARKALTLSKPQGIIEITRDAHQQLYKIYKQQRGKTQAALYHHEQYAALKDSMLSASKVNLINHLKHKVKLEQKNKRIAEQEKQLIETEQGKQRNLYLLLIAGVVILLLISFFYSLYRRQKLKIKTRTQQLKVEQQEHELSELNLKNQQLANKELETQLDFKKQELLSYALSMTHKNQILQELNEQVDTLNTEGQEKEIRKIKNNINAAMGSQENWEEFKTRFEQVHHSFFDTLKALYPQLSPNDLRMCAFIKLNLSSKQIASLLNIAPASVDMGKYRLKKKFGMENDESLSELIERIQHS